MMTKEEAVGADESVRAPREFFWVPNGWTTEPGENCLPLDPPNSGVIKTLPDSKRTVFESELPPLQDEVKVLNKTYLEVTSGLANNRWIAVLPGLLGIIAFSVGAPVLLWMTFIEVGFFRYPGLHLMNLFMMPLLFMVVYSLFTIAFFSPDDEPIRFSRNDRKVYFYRARRSRWLGMDVYRLGKPEIKAYNWSQCRAEVVRKVITSGRTARRDCFLELAIIDVESQKVVERFRVGDRDVYGDFSRRVFLWETIRRYMEEGTERVPPPTLQVHRGTLVDCIEDFNPFSIPTKSSPGAQRDVGYFFAAVLLVMSLLFVPLVLSRWIACRVSRKVDWGELDNTTFRIAADDPAMQRSLRPEIAAPRLWRKELRRRQQAAWMWFGVVLAQVSGLWWFFATPSY
jgi:hypothetical protein